MQFSIAAAIVFNNTSLPASDAIFCFQDWSFSAFLSIQKPQFLIALTLSETLTNELAPPSSLQQLRSFTPTQIAISNHHNIHHPYQQPQQPLYNHLFPSRQQFNNYSFVVSRSFLFIAPPKIAYWFFCFLYFCFGPSSFDFLFSSLNL